MSYQVTVHEYAGALQTLSTEDMDQLLLNARLEECSVTVDRSLNRILEVIVAINKTRSQRDLGTHTSSLVDSSLITHLHTCTFAYMYVCMHSFFSLLITERFRYNTDVHTSSL